MFSDIIVERQNISVFRVRAFKGSYNKLGAVLSMHTTRGVHSSRGRADTCSRRNCAVFAFRASTKDKILVKVANRMSGVEENLWDRDQTWLVSGNGRFFGSPCKVWGVMSFGGG